MTIVIRGCVMLLLIAPSGFARDETHVNPSGFTLTYPDSWFQITNSELKEIIRAHPNVSNFIRKNNLDLSRIDFALFRDTDSDIPASINVIASPRQWTIDEVSGAEIKDQLTAQYRKRGVELNGLQCRIRKVGSRDAIVVDYTVTMSEILPQIIRQRQLYIPGGGKTYCITFSAADDEFGKLEAEFEEVLSGFHAPEPIPATASQHAHGDDSSRKLLTYGGVGLFIAVICAFKTLMRRNGSSTSSV